jgi:hypothetical protein
MSAPERITTGLFATDESGAEITRANHCYCGKAFTQRILGMRFLGMVERIRQSAVQAIADQIPGYWCPVHCPSCERKALRDFAVPVERVAYTVPDSRREWA